MSDHLVRVTFFLCLTSLVSASVQEILGFQQSEPEAVDLRLEEKKDYYKKWLRQDVTYIITDEEREIFDQLSTDDEKEQFIEEFWRRRDPTRNTLVNEYKEEHYRRIAYANDHFSSGFDGWKTDRGRIYIMYGPPAEILRNPSGGGYDRPVYEGGGATSTYPFETWRYRFIEGMGDEVILEFVDKSWTGEYKLALSPDEKDVWLNNAGGQTLAEQRRAAGHQGGPASPGESRRVWRDCRLGQWAAQPDGV